MENVADIYPLTPTQAGILYHTLRAPENGVYFEQISCTLRGALDVALLQQAWRAVVARHPALRTLFLWEGVEEPLQVVRETVTVPWELYDWRDCTPAEQAERLADLRAAQQARGFDLKQAPLLRLVLARTAENEHHFIWNFHHLLTDGWSTHLVFSEAWTTYETLLRGEQPALPPARPFRHYLAWLKKQDMAAAERYWRQRLAGFSAPTPLRVDLPAPETAVAYGEASRMLPAGVTGGLQALAQRERLTLNTFVQGAWALLLSRYSGEEDVVFGATQSGRPADIPDVAKMVGMFINTLPLRVRADGDQPLLPWLRQLQTQQLEVQQLAYSPLVSVQQWSDVPAGEALFDSIVVFENYPAAEKGAARTLQVADVRYREQSNYPLALLVVPGERLQLLVIYNEYRFAADAIARLLGHLETLLTAMADDPSRTLGTLPLLTTAERQQLASWNDTTVPVTAEACIHTLIAAHGSKTPLATAVAASDGRLTYAELVARANRLAHRLLALGVEPGTPVGLYSERAADMVVGILGIMQAGGAYVPLDPAYPAERISFVLADTKSPLVVTQTHLAAGLPQTAAAIVLIDDNLANERAGAPKTAVSADDLAYIIYTSGSTGTPKGVMVSHRNLLASTLAREEVYDEPVGSYLLLSSSAFDSSVAGIFWTLLLGGTLVLPAPGEEQDVARLAALVAREQVTHTLALPSLYRLLLAYAPAGSLRSLRTAIVAGEACPPDLSADHYGRLPDTALVNEYGPTEATVWCTAYRLPRVMDGTAVPIGPPIPNARIVILDHHGQPAPIGVPGELYVGGAGVTQGYLNRPELTAQRFVALQFENDDLQIEGVYYRTGDLAYWRADGAILFLGRVDNQVKIRGFRIEPGEIEAALQQHPAVVEAAVTVWERPASGRGADRQLVAYVVSDGAAVDEGALRAYLDAQLPVYMVPTYFVPLPEMPRTPNGKIDRRRLPEPEGVAGQDRELVLPQTPAEQTLAAIWTEVLRLPQIGVHDRFFELGGDSILSIQVVARARAAGLALTPRQLFSEQTIARLAALAESAPENGAGDVPETAETGEIPLTPIQHWFFGQQLAAPAHWNQAVWLEATTAVHTGYLEAALAQLVQRHAALRTRFRQTEEGWRQEIAETAAPLRLQRQSLAQQPAALQDEAMAAVAAQVQTSFNLSSPPLLRAMLFDLGAARSPRLLLVAHHLVIDAVSWTILLADLAAAYRQLALGQPVTLPPVRASWAQWGRRLAALADEALQQQELEYWLRAAPAATPVAVDPNGSCENTEANARFMTVTLDAARTESLLRDVHRAYETKIDDVLLAALLRAVHVWRGRRELLLTLERHGREEIDAQRDFSQTVGWFTTLFPITLALDETDDPGANLRHVKEQLRRVPQQGIGYGMLRYLADAGTRRKLAALPQPELLFNYLGQVDALTASNELFQPVTADAGPAYGLQNGRAHLLDVNARIENGRLHVTWQYATGRFRTEQIEVLAQAYVAQLALLIDHCTGAKTAVRPPRVTGSCALSPMQRLMMLHAMTVDRRRDVLFNQIVYRLRGPLDAAAFRKAWQHTVDRHPVLRTRFVWPQDEEPRQEVLSRAELPWALYDWREDDEATQAQRLEQLLAEDRGHGFDLERPPLQRLTLIRRAAADYWMVWSSHHLVLDRWCIGLILDEVAAAYAADYDSLDQAPAYSAYIEWLAQQDEEEARDFWQTALQDLAARPLPWLAEEDATGGETETTEVVLDAAETAVLRRFAMDHDLTLGTLVPAAWGVVLGAATGADDALFGLTVSGRPAVLPGVTGIVGSFINNVPLRLPLPDRTPVAAWLGEVQAAQLALQPYEFASPAQIQAWRGERAYGPLFDSLVVVQAAVRYKMPSGIDLQFERGGLQTGYPVSLEAVPGVDDLRLRLTVERGRVPAAAAARLADGLQQVLRAMPGLAAARLADLRKVVQPETAVLPAPEKAAESDEVARLLPGSSLQSRLLDQWQEVLGTDEIGVTDDFFALGGTSLQAMQLVTQIEQDFGARLPLTSFLHEATVAHLATEIGQYVDARAWPLVVDIQPHGEQLPFFCVHGLTGDVLWFRELGALMAPDQPFYGLQAQGLDGIQPAVDNLPDMAALYIDAMRTRQPRGPYFLGGASFGGTVALEMAQQLRAQGEEVALLVMFDHVPGAERVDAGRWRAVRETWSRLQNAPRWLASFMELGPERIWLRVQRKTRVAVKELAQRIGSASEDGIASADMIDYADRLPQHRQRLIEAHATAILTYRPEEYAGRVVLFKARTRPLLHQIGDEEAWRALGGKGDGIVTVPGSHEGIFMQPRVTALASALRQQLALARGE